MILTSKPLASVVFAVLFGGILIANQMGLWKTSGSKVPAQFTAGEFAGQANPADIRGSYTFGDIEKNFGIPSAILAQAFSVQSGDPAAFTVKSLEEIYAGSETEIGTSSVRLFVAFYNSMPFDLSTDIYLPESAAILLRERTLSNDAAAYLKAHTLSEETEQPASTVPQLTGTPQTTSTAPETSPAVHVTAATNDEHLVRGKTTFAELLSWGVSQAVIEQILGMPLPADLSTTLKDFCSANGLNFETIKPALQTEADKL